MAAPARSRILRPRVLALAVLALALVLRVLNLTGRSLWLDEAVEYWTATSPLFHLPAYVREIIQDPPLYSFLLHVWMTPSHHEAWLRLLSVLFGIGSVAGVMVIGYRLSGRVVALAAGLLMAVMPTSIYYSQEVGQYAPMQCLIIWCTVALLGVASEPSRRAYVRWGVLAAAAMYTYYGTVLPVIVPFLCWLGGGIVRHDRARVRGGLITLGAVFVAVLPLLIYFIPSQLHRGPTAGGLEVGTVSSVTQGAGEFLKALKVTFAFWFTGWPSTGVSEWVTIVLVLTLLGFAIQVSRGFALWVGVTTLVYALIGWMHIFPFGFRHSLILAPLFVVLIACAFAGAPSRAVRVTVVAVFATLCLAAVLSPSDRQLRKHLFGKTEAALWPESEDIGAATKYWAEHRSPEQPTYVYYAAAPSFAYYAELYTRNTTARPPDWFLHCWRNRDDAPWCHEGGVYYGRWLRAMKPEEKAESVFQTMNQVPDEFWFVLAHSQKNEAAALQSMLHQHFDFGDHYAGDNAVAALLRRANR